jgi:hypothetical protein
MAPTGAVFSIWAGNWQHLVSCLAGFVLKERLAAAQAGGAENHIDKHQRGKRRGRQQLVNSD